RSARRASLRTGCREHAVNVFSDGCRILGRKIELRHSLVLPGSVNDRSDQFAVLVAHRKLRTHEIRSAQIPAAQVTAVAWNAVHAEDGFAARDHVWRCQLPLLLWKIRCWRGAGTGSSGTATATCGSLLRCRSRSLCSRCLRSCLRFDVTDFA